MISGLLLLFLSLALCDFACDSGNPDCERCLGRTSTIGGECKYCLQTNRCVGVIGLQLGTVSCNPKHLVDACPTQAPTPAPTPSTVETTTTTTVTATTTTTQNLPDLKNKDAKNKMNAIIIGGAVGGAVLMIIIIIIIVACVIRKKKAGFEDDFVMPNTIAMTQQQHQPSQYSLAPPTLDPDTFPASNDYAIAPPPLMTDNQYDVVPADVRYTAPPTLNADKIRN